MCNLLKCELCDYTAKQLFQHIKVVHNISVEEYRNMFGMDRPMQINFNPPTNDVDKKISKYVSFGHIKIKNKIQSINEIYSKDETIRLLETLNGQIYPRYNKKSIPIIENKAKELGITDIQQAENGGEYYIKELGYWLDGYSKEKNIVIEYDEKHHFDSNGKLRLKDIQRQTEIENYLNCKFIRISAI